MEQGEGIGPKVRFNYEKLEVGGPFVNSVQKYEIMMENLGHIDAPFQLQPGGLGRRFQVSPTSGIVKPGEKMPITIIFSPDFVGDFDEAFFWSVQVRSFAMLFVTTNPVGVARSYKIPLAWKCPATYLSF